MHDHAVHRLRALHGRQPLLLPVPVLARTIPIGRDRAVGEHHLGRTPAESLDPRRRGGRFEGPVAHDARSRRAHLFEKLGIPPAPATFVVRRARQIQMAPGSRHRHVKQAALLGDHVLAAADQRLEHYRRQLKPRRPS